MSSSQRLRPSITAALLEQIGQQLAAVQEAHRLDQNTAINLISRDGVRRSQLTADRLRKTYEQFQVVTTMHSFESQVVDFLADSNTQLANLEHVIDCLTVSETAETLFNIVRQLLPPTDFWPNLNQLKNLVFPSSDITLLDALVLEYLRVKVPASMTEISLSFGQIASLSDACPLLSVGLAERVKQLQNFSFANFGNQLNQLEVIASQIEEFIGQPSRNQLAILRGVLEAAKGEIAAVQTRLDAAKVKVEETLKLYSYVSASSNEDENLKTFLS